MSILSRWGLKAKLIILAGLPSLALIIFALYFLASEYHAVVDMKRAKMHAQLVIKLDALVTYLLTENEQIMHLMADKIAVKKTEQVSGIEKKMLAAISEYGEYLETQQDLFDDPGEKKQIEQSLSHMEEQLKLEGMDDSNPALSSYYNSPYARVQLEGVRLMDYLIERAARGEIAREILSYSPLFEEEIMNGIERHMVYNGLAKGQFTESTLENMESWAGMYEAYKQMYLLASKSNDDELYLNYTKQPSYSESLAIIKKIIKKGKQGPYETTPQAWQQVQSAKMQELNRIQEIVLKRVKERVDTALKNSLFTFYATLASLLLILAIIFLLGRAIYINILQPLHSAGQLANLVGVEVSQILASITEVSAATMETAAAVTETTTTSEELKQTAQVAVEKAKDVSESSADAFKILKKSEVSLESTTDGMNKIHEGMKIISESIMKLSDRSKAIGEIIETVNDLAQQSNLLAVNAAIEAAKAGEQGKGFGVVAQEVRSLAEQSKQATVQVRSLLNEIQNATNTVVMASEQGSKAVVNGMQCTAETGQAMHSLSAGVSKMSQSATQISASNQQQLIGIAQVNEAMREIKEASDHHSERIKQIEEAVGSLHIAGEKLLNLVKQTGICTDG